MSTIGTLKYRRYQAKSPQDPDAPAKWYARAVQDRTVEFEDFVTHISEHNSPYSRGVIHLITGVHLNVRNTKTWSNAELRKSTRVTELTVYTGGGTLTDDGTGGGTDGDDDGGGQTGTPL